MSKILIAALITILSSNSTVFANSNDLLQEGKRALESGQYEEAVNCLGHILKESNNISYDPKVLALNRVIQAYGMLRLKDRGYDKMIEENLLGAISQDPEWEYPKKLLGELYHFKNLK